MACGRLGSQSPGRAGRLTRQETLTSTGSDDSRPVDLACSTLLVFLVIKLVYKPQGQVFLGETMYTPGTIGHSEESKYKYRGPGTEYPRYEARERCRAMRSDSPE